MRSTIYPPRSADVPSALRSVARALFSALCALTFITLYRSPSAHAQETQCAQVRIEIAQELSFERQAFEAGMRITNGLPTTPLQNVNVQVLFTDENGTPVPATQSSTGAGLFFYNVSLLSNISNVTGTGVVPAGQVSEIHWLIIPTPGAAGGTSAGKRYFVGARLTYERAGVPEVIEVAPDWITVRPQPELHLDYFLPINVRADEPNTLTVIEPPIPFTLGLRIKNQGLGQANNVRIQSAQPNIIENVQQLLINFIITGSFVDNEPAQNSLLINYGNLGPNMSRTGRWVMESTLSGQFVSFSASFSHADELGGQLTSIIPQTAIGAHRLIKDVLVDLPGRDEVRDFLACDGLACIPHTSFPRLFESEGLDSPVTNVSNSVAFGLLGSSGGVTSYYVDVPPTAGAFYAWLPDPHQGTQVVRQARRLSDGKLLPAENAWFQVEDTGPATQYSFNLFDINGGGRYVIDVGPPILGQVPPVLQFISNWSVTAGQRLTFLVHASDPNGTIPTLSVDALPLGATFQDYGDGSGQFDWQTTVTQAGAFPVTFRASDGTSSAARTPTITVQVPGDADGDGMLDVWEMLYFGSLNQGPNDDFDHDGLTNLAEFLLGTDPTNAANAPGVPVIESPLVGGQITDINPTLVVRNATHGVETPQYDFELYSDAQYRRVIHRQANVSEGATRTSLFIDVDLTENQHYYWRARAALNAAASEWVYGDFILNAQNEPPSAAVPVSPGPNEISVTRDPRLTVANAVDPEGDKVTYTFGLAAVEAGQLRYLFGFNVPEGVNGTTSWVAHLPPQYGAPYVWAVRASDPQGAYTDSVITPLVIDTTIGAPGEPLIINPTAQDVVTSDAADLIAKVDPQIATAGTFHFEIDTSPAFNSPMHRTYAPAVSRPGTFEVHQKTGALTPGRRYYWRVRAVHTQRTSAWAVSSFLSGSPATSLRVNSIVNPDNRARVDTLRPLLSLFAAEGADTTGQLSYRFELYRDPALLQLVEDAVSPLPRYRVQQPLLNNSVYFWRARVEEPISHVTSAWITPQVLVISRDPTNDPPEISLVSPQGPQSVRADQSLSFHWVDSDPDSDASVYFYLNNTRLPATALEDEDGPSDTLEISAASVPPGVYTINAAISDGLTERRDTSCCQVTVTPPSPTADGDGDGIPDFLDNCRYTYNPNQLDRGGFMTSTPDGIGDACQCGDVDGSGIVDSADTTHLKSALSLDVPTILTNIRLCNLTPEGDCTSADKEALDRAIASHVQPPQLCQAARPW